MNAIRAHEFGDPDVLALEDVSQPEPAADEALVRVHAASVNPIDWIVRRGEFDDPIRATRPWIPGWDLSGVVESVGSDVETLSPHDAVHGMVRMPRSGSAYAEYATVPADEVVRKPASLDHVGAAAVPMVGLTAWRALFEEVSVGPGDRVLIHAAAGGVGHVAVQLAKAAGATVVGTASGNNERFLRDLGVDEFVDYRIERFEAVVDDVDVVLDGVGGDTLERSAEVLVEGGDLVTLPVEPDAEQRDRLRREHGVETHWFSVEPDAAVLGEIDALVDEGWVEPVVSETYPLAEAAAAHDESETGHVRGKLVLDVRAESDA